MNINAELAMLELRRRIYRFLPLPFGLRGGKYGPELGRGWFA